MGKHLLREDKECQNCGRTVEENYCPNCGQKNTETRQSFGHLFTHFLEDLTYYDTAFWKTIKHLIFRPARLTKEYLAGKRQSYVPPVKLYIFISFLTFFIPAMLPDTEERISVEETTTSATVNEEHASMARKLTTEEKVWVQNLSSAGRDLIIPSPMYYESVAEMDSIEKIKPEHLRLSPFEYKMGKRLLNLYAHNSPRQVGQKFSENFVHNIPKVLFFYLPLFALVLWLFHSKKRWYFFDHGIFTLHYFSFVLLINTILIVLYNCAYLSGSDIVGIIFLIYAVVAIIWQIYYFYRAHRKMYNESWLINFIKSSLMFFINICAIVFILIIYTYITIYNLH